MAKKLSRSLKGSTIFLTTLALSVALVGCGSREEPMPEEPAAPEEVANIGVALSSPGLASGSDPAATSGAEIFLAQALVSELATVEADTQIRWVPLNNVKDEVIFLQNEDLEFILGQLSDDQLSDQLAWVGPYATVHPALLVRTTPDATVNASDEVMPLAAITSADELAQAPICVVADSISATADLPVDKVTVEQTVTECEIGMRSGRYDAIAADDMQLAGVLLDENRSAAYGLLRWSEIADEDHKIPDELLDVHHYWIATDPAQCEAVAEALRSVVKQGALAEAFSGWEEITGFTLGLARASEITTQHCQS